MFMKKRKKLNKRGFSLAESVIALAVIAIASVGILSLILSAQRSTFSAMQKQQAQIYAADIISCYRADGDFNQNVEFALGLEKDALKDYTWLESKQITLDGDLVANIKIENKTITVQIVNGEKELFSQFFTKGDTP